jgi:hypothetical protein
VDNASLWNRHSDSRRIGREEESDGRDSWQIKKIFKQATVKPGAREHEALMKRIRALAVEHQALVDAARKRDISK